ncbi:PLP-dependent aminotransferase family protein [Oscillospiraceae bacterium WX1]
MIELTVSLQKEGRVPLYEQLYAHIRQEIISGAFVFNTRLPSKRQLAAHLACSQNTVLTAYSQLLAEGYITARPKIGYYVNALDNMAQLEKGRAQPQRPTKEPEDCRYDFSHHGVDPIHFPFAAWRKITKDVINEWDEELLKTGHRQGHPDLRAAIATYLYQSRGVVCSPEQIVVSAGTELLLQLLIQLFDENVVYAIENPGYEKLNLIFKSSRASYKTVDLDENGMRPDVLLKSGADIACVTPSHQFPTGRIMPVSRRIQLLNWTRGKEGRYIVEDDYDSEFRYDGRPISSLQGLDGSGKVIYLGAFSKSLTPALRVSYMVLPERLLQSYHEKLNFYMCPVPTVEQKALYRFIQEGHFERHLNKMRMLYKQKRERLVSSIRSLLPNAVIEGASTGLHFVLKIDNGQSEKALIEAAKTLKVRVYGLSQYYFEQAPSMESALLLGFAAIKYDDIYDAVSRLKSAWVR